jgi:tyrosine-protein kinase Etk/Wzc
MSYHDILNSIIFNWKKILSITLLSVVFLFLILLLVYPRTYTSTVSILPPEKNQSSGGLSSLLQGADFGSLLTGGLTSANSQLYIEILKSRSASEYVVRKYNLLKYLKSDDIYEASHKLSSRLDLDLNKEGIIKISVEVDSPIFPIFSQNDSSAILAANLSNAFVEALDKINREKSSSKAKSARIYIEEQLISTKENLQKSESALMEFQQKNKTISLPDQLKAVIDGAAKLKTEMVETEIQIGLLGTNLRDDNRTLVGLRDKLSNLQKQYDKIEIGNQDFLLAFQDVPELSRELATLIRDVKIQNEVYLILQQQYYKEKIQENRDLPTIEVLDEAVPPKNASSPRIIYSSVFGGVFVFLLVSLFIVLSEKNYLKFKS